MKINFIFVSPMWVENIPHLNLQNDVFTISKTLKDQVLEYGLDPIRGPNNMDGCYY